MGGIKIYWCQFKKKNHHIVLRTVCWRQGCNKALYFFDPWQWDNVRMSSRRDEGTFLSLLDWLKLPHSKDAKNVTEEECEAEKKRETQWESRRGEKIKAQSRRRWSSRWVVLTLRLPSFSNLPNSMSNYTEDREREVHTQRNTYICIQAKQEHSSDILFKSNNDI